MQGRRKITSCNSAIWLVPSGPKLEQITPLRLPKHLGPITYPKADSEKEMRLLQCRDPVPDTELTSGVKEKHFCIHQHSHSNEQPPPNLEKENAALGK
jgi:hypothetical protein